MNQKQDGKKNVVIALFIAWLLSICIAHVNQFNLSPLLAVGVFLRPLLISVFVLLLAALGREILVRARLAFGSVYEQMLFGFVTGSLLTGYGLYAVGGFIGVNRVSYALFLGLVCTTGGLSLRKMWPELISSYQTGKEATTQLTMWHKTLLGLTGVAILTSLICALVPPFFYDTLLFHYGTPNYYIQTGAIGYNPYQQMSNWPQFTHQFYTAFLLLDSYLLANAWNWIHFPLTVMAIWALAWRILPSKSLGIYAATIFAFTPVIAEISIIPLVDIELTFYATMTILGLVLSYVRNTDDLRVWVLPGLATGVGCAIKYQAVPYVVMPAFVTLIAISIRRRPDFVKLIRSGLIYGMVLGVVGSVFYIRNWVVTGNPVYPLLHTVFDGRNWTEEQSQTWKKFLTSRGPSPQEHVTGIKNLVQLKSAAYVSTMASYLYERFSKPGTDSGQISGLFFLIVGPFVLMWLKKPLVRLLFIFVMSGFLFWLFSFYNLRYLATSFGVASVLMGYVLTQYEQTPARFWRLVLRKGFVIIVLINGWYIAMITAKFEPLKVVLASEPPSHYLNRQLTHYAGIEFINTLPAEETKVLFVGETRGAYCDRPFMANSAYDYNPLMLALEQSTTVDEARQKLRAQGYTHVFVNFSELKRLTSGWNYLRGLSPDKSPLLNRFWQEACTMVYQNPDFKDVVVLKLHP